MAKAQSGLDLVIALAVLNGDPKSLTIYTERGSKDMTAIVTMANAEQADDLRHCLEGEDYTNESHGELALTAFEIPLADHRVADGLDWLVETIRNDGGYRLLVLDIDHVRAGVLDGTLGVIVRETGEHYTCELPSYD